MAGNGLRGRSLTTEEGRPITASSDTVTGPEILPRPSGPAGGVLDRTARAVLRAFRLGGRVLVIGDEM